jgi:cyclase
MRRVLPLLLTTALAALAACLPAEIFRVVPTRLSDGLTFVRGGGGNSLVLVRGERALVFDSKLWPYGDEVARVVEAAGARATLLVNSHLHADHAGANALFAGATLVAAPSTLDYLRERRLGPHGAWMPVKGRATLQLGGEPVVVGALGAAHTGSDVYAYLPARRVLATGDVFQAPYFPHVDARNGGSMLGLVRALDELVKVDADVVIPGHGPAASKAELVAYRDFMRALRDEVGARRAKGEADEAIVAAMVAPRGEPYVAMEGVSSREDVVRCLVRELAPR